MVTLKAANNTINIITKKDFIYEKNNIFIVTTAFQLLGAIEASKYFENRNNVLILLFYGSNIKDVMQLKKISKLFNYNTLIEVNFSQLKKFELMQKTIDLLKVIHNISPTVDKIFTGFYSANLRRIISNINYNEFYLLDDGVYTISIHNELFNENLDIGRTKYIRKYSEKERKTFFKRVLFYMFHYFRYIYFYLHGYQNDIKNKKNLNFFTMFNIKQIQQEKIIIHNFDKVKKLYQNNTIQKKINDNIFFLGQPLNRVLSISNETYLEYIKNYILIKGFENKQIFYIPHRAENTEIIKEIVNISKNIKVLKLDEPFEVYCLKNYLTINCLVSFISTALYSIKKLYPKTEIDAIKLNNNRQYSIDSKEIYEEFHKIGINVYEI